MAINVELPTEMWDMIFHSGKLTECDKLVVSQSYPLFEAVLNKHVFEQSLLSLLPKLLPYISKNCFLLTIRSLNKVFKSKAEDIIELALSGHTEDDEDQSGLKRLIPTTVVCHKSKERSMSLLLQNLNKYKGTGTSLLGRSLVISIRPEDGDDPENDVLLKQLRSLRGKLFQIQVNARASSVMKIKQQLQLYLSKLPELRRVELNIEIDCATRNHFNIETDIMGNNVWRREKINLPFLECVLVSSWYIICGVPRKNFIPQDLFFLNLFRDNYAMIRNLKISHTMLNFFLKFLCPIAPFLCLTEADFLVDDEFELESLKEFQCHGVKLRKLTLRWNPLYIEDEDKMKANLEPCLQAHRDSLTCLHITIVKDFRFERFVDLQLDLPHLQTIILTNSMFESTAPLFSLKALRNIHYNLRPSTKAKIDSHYIAKAFEGLPQLIRFSYQLHKNVTPIYSTRDNNNV